MIYPLRLHHIASLTKGMRHLLQGLFHLEESPAWRVLFYEIIVDLVYMIQSHVEYTHTELKIPVLCSAFPIQVILFLDVVYFIDEMERFAVVPILLQTRHRRAAHFPLFVFSILPPQYPRY